MALAALALYLSYLVAQLFLNAIFAAVVLAVVFHPLPLDGRTWLQQYRRSAAIYRQRASEAAQPPYLFALLGGVKACGFMGIFIGPVGWFPLSNAKAETGFTDELHGMPRGSVQILDGPRGEGHERPLRQDQRGRGVPQKMGRTVRIRI